MSAGPTVAISTVLPVGPRMRFPTTATAPVRLPARLPPGPLAALLALAVMTVPGGGPAEERAAPIELSLAEAVRRAGETSETVAIARASVERARGEELQAESRRWPQLLATASYTRTLASEFDEVFPGRAAGADGDGGGGTGGGAGDGEAAGTFEDLPFGRENAWRAGLSLTWELWAGGRIGSGVTAAEAAAESRRLALDAELARTVLDTVQTYYDAVLAERLLSIAEASLEQADRTLRLTREERAAGAKPEFELLRAQVARDNLLPEVARRRIDRDLAGLRLKELLDLPPGAALRLTSDLEEGGLAELEEAVPEVAAPAAEVPEERRVAVREARLAVDAREAALDAARGGRLPSLALTSDYGLVQYPEDPWPTGSDWRDNWTVGLGLQVPLFTGFRIAGEVRSARAELADARARLRQARERTRLDTEAARRERQAAVATFEATGGTVGQAQRAYEIAEVRYREGISTQLELTDARLQLQQARANRALAARDLQVARVRVALLPRLPLAGAAGAGDAAEATGGAGLQASPVLPAAPPSSPTVPAAGRSTR